MNKYSYLFLFCMICVGCVFMSASIEAAQIIKKEEIREHILEKIEFDGHTYVHYKRKYNCVDHGFLHDPSCKCKEITDEKIAEIIKLVTREKK